MWHQALTRENGGHQGREHEEQHGKEEEAGVAQDLLGFVPDAQVQEADEEADSDVRRDPQVRQDLWADMTLSGLRARRAKAWAPRLLGAPAPLSLPGKQARTLGQLAHAHTLTHRTLCCENSSNCPA